MKKKNFNFIGGVVVGAVLFGGLPSLAGANYNVTPNPFKITLDAQEVQIDGFNINGNTYFKLRDIGDKVGFDVDFKENVIMIITNNTNHSVNSVKNESYGYYEALRENFSEEIKEYQGDEYWYGAFFNQIAITGDKTGLDPDHQVGLAFNFIIHDDGVWLEDKNGNVVSEVIPYYDIPWYKSGATLPCIKYSDFETHIKPHIDKVLDEYGIPK